MIQSDNILFIPSLRRGNGTGHLKRCLDWGRKFDRIHIAVHKNGEEELLDYINLPLCSHYKNIVWHEAPGRDWDLIVLDNRSTDNIPEELRGIPLIALDDTGVVRDQASYVMDTLPSLHDRKMNSDGYRFLNRPFYSSIPESVTKILITFGGEDSYDLTGRVYRALESESIQRVLRSFNIQVDIVDPSNNLRINENNSLQVLSYIDKLSDKLKNYDLVICQYGMTAFETLSSRRFVFLLNPGSYHDKLSRSAGLPFGAEACTMTSSQLTDALLETLKQDRDTFEKLKKIHTGLWQKYSKECENFGEWIISMSISSDLCPVCGSHVRIELERFENKSYFQCKHCKMKYMVQFRIKEDIYSEDYFFSDYKKQYGKTYLEDFHHIQKMAEKRLNHIKHINPDAKDLLDIGCAYGPFLKTAFERGYNATGLDISQDAVNYITENFKGVRSFQGDLNTEETRRMFPESAFSLITLWYVIEHFSNLEEILPYLCSRLKEKGVLAMATPYSSGVSGRFNKRQFYNSSPEDHFTIWDRKSARISLRRAGFKKIRFVSTGHHPERFPRGIRNVVPGRLLMIISRAFGWGDTFEIYAQKG